MRMTVNAWDPSYANSGERVTAASRGQIDVSVECDAAHWSPITVPLIEPGRVLLVDGVRRLDARIDVDGDDGVPVPGICASYAAGVVVCDLSNERPTASLAASAIQRGVFSSAKITDVSAGRLATYYAHRVSGDDASDLVNAVQDRLTALEVEVAEMAEPGMTDLLVIDGALRRRAHLARAVGFIKSHMRRYLLEPESHVVQALAPGQRTPIFLLDAGWKRYTWYLRLPGGGDGSWAGIARLECAIDHIDDVVTLANMSATVLPRLASSPHKDPRAPQNLTPIAGLERALRSKLGDSRLLLRGLRVSNRT